MPFLRSFFLLLATLSLAACSSGGGGGSSGGQHVDTTRSAVCLQFQKTFCDWSWDSCHSVGAVSRAMCDESLSSLYCKSDATAQACTAALASAACDATPAACVGISDPQPALDACKQLITGVCGIASRCNSLDGQSLDDCQADGELQLCVGVVGALPSINTCIDNLNAAACPGLGEKLTLPDTCKGVIKQSLTSGSASSPSSLSPDDRWQSLAGPAPGGLSAR